MNFITQLLSEISDEYTENRFSAIGNEKERKEIEQIISKHLPRMNKSLSDSGYTKLNTVGDIATIIYRYARRGARLLDVGETDSDDSGKQKAPKEGVNVIPVAEDLVKYGLLKRVGENTYRFANIPRTNAQFKPLNKKIEALRQLISLKKSDQEVHYASTGEIKSSGRLSTNLEVNRDSGELGYGTGRDKSGLEYARIAETIKSNDSGWANISNEAKEIIQDLRQLSDPVAAFIIIRKLISLREMKTRSKKNYTQYVEAIKSSFDSDPSYADVSQQLDGIGVIDADTLTLDLQKIQSIREAISYLSKDSDDLGITGEQKIKAFLPNFSEKVKASVRSRGVESVKNMLVTGRMSKVGQLAVRQIMLPDMDQELFDRIIKRENPTEVQRVIADISKLFGTTDLNQLRKDIQNKEKLRKEYSGEENKAQIAKGRAEEFSRLFRI